MTQDHRIRADELVVEQGLAESRSKAKALILAREVRHGDRVIQKPGEMVDSAIELTLRDKPPFVSRGGLKLAHALDTFGIDVDGIIAADLGASTGGFTDCLLQRGAARVYAIDVGYGQLDYRLRVDRRVVVMERVNARYLESLPEKVAFVCIDVSFIGLGHILPATARLLTDDGQCIALIKPQFEAGRNAVGKGGVVRDDAIRSETVLKVARIAEQYGFGVRGLTRSPITGPAGNVEFLVWLRVGAESIDVERATQALFQNDRLGAHD
jgi:23S rRNA (cytidine1920-2'-O)/16S rRNA (cytidine1409-2'-O)-methyltransferase